MGFALKKPAGEPGKSWPAILIGLFVAFGGVLFGYDTGTISGILAMPYWQQLFSTGYIDPEGNPNVSPQQTALVVSILSAGTFVGALAAAYLADHTGRRLGLIFSSLLFIVGVVLQAISVSLPLFIVGRGIAGTGVGLLSAIVPLYQSETAPKWIRGVIVGSYQFAITVGLLLAAVVDNATRDRDDTSCYRIPVAIQILWALVLIVGMAILPETPRYLIKQNQREKAKKSLSTLRRLDLGDVAIKTELDEITANYEAEHLLGSASYLDCFRGGIGKRLLTGCFLQALQQLTGINFIFYYGTKFFKNSGITDAFTVQMITSAVNVASTLPGLYLLDKWGRRPMLLGGAAGMGISQLLVGICGTLFTAQNVSGEVYSTNLAGQRASIAFVCIYIFFFAATWGPTPWVICGEIYPLKVRAKAVSMTTATNWLINWAIAFSTPYLVDYGKGNANLQSKIFFVWAGACIGAFVFAYFMVYETKGLGLEQVDDMYEECKSARKSKNWNPATSPRGLARGEMLARKRSESPGDGKVERVEIRVVDKEENEGTRVKQKMVAREEYVERTEQESVAKQLTMAKQEVDQKDSRFNRRVAKAEEEDQEEQDEQETQEEHRIVAQDPPQLPAPGTVGNISTTTLLMCGQKGKNTQF